MQKQKAGSLVGCKIKFIFYKLAPTELVSQTFSISFIKSYVSALSLKESCTKRLHNTFQILEWQLAIPLFRVRYYLNANESEELIN